KAQKSVKGIPILWPNGPLLAPSPITNKIPAPIETIIVDPDHVPIGQFGPAVVEAVGHYQTEEYPISRRFLDPFQGLDILGGPIVSFVVFQKVDPKIGCPDLDKMFHIALYPFLGTGFAGIHPV